MRRLDDLQCNGLVIVQDSEDYSFTSDAVMLANYIKPRQGDVVAELCSGSGVISILATVKTKAAAFYCFEISQSLCDMCRESLQLNGIDNVKVFNNSISQAPKLLAGKNVDVVVVNPPYFKVAKGVQTCPNPKIAAATHEVHTNLAEICEVASKILKYGGKLYMCYPSDRFAELCHSLISVGIQPKEVKFVRGAAGKQISLVLITAVRAGKPGLKVSIC